MIGRYLTHLLLLFFLILPFSAESHKNVENPGITAQEILSHVRYLASDELKGRKAGTEGCEKAADYIATNFKRIGLKPLGENGTYLQDFSFTSGIKLGKRNYFAIESRNRRSELEPGSDFLPLGFSASGNIHGELVFAGYGISAPKLNYDDYTELDVRDKIVMVLRYTPDPKSPFFEFASLRYKAINAREKGAKGIIFVAPFSQEEEYLGGLRYDLSFTDSGIQAVMLKKAIAEEIFRAVGENGKDLELKLSKKKTHSFYMPGVKVHIQTELIKENSVTSNVVGFLPGSDPYSKNEVIIVGAHYDHIGLGDRASRGIEDRTKGKIHNGADDNASGVAGLLELADYFSHNRSSLKRSILFIAFSAEELGLLGSSHYVKNPAIPLERTVAMINMDMIGRMEKDTLTVLGAGSSPRWKPLLDKANSNFNLALKISDSGFAPSDQTVFYARDIPVLQFFTGVHQDYHTPDDDWQKINTEGIKKILELISGLIWELDGMPTRIAFSAVKEEQKTPTRFSVYLGTIPDYSEEPDGVKLMGVKKGSPAEKAGLRRSDIIIGLDQKTIKNIYDYVYALGQTKPGIPTEVVVLRGNRRMTLSIVPEPRPNLN
ncbi:MAG TPA: M20/M25/M40 family metallo-hydrolase [Thermodesulfobacteriota bacterium]|nr:M20/M25/M40 family metallo-hydrolase [Thermodesulfobacteriota bacterium]